MIFAKSAFLVSFLALSNVVVASGPSACLLSAVGQQENPADMKAMCVTNTKRVQKEIADTCGDDKDDVLKEYAQICADNDHKVEITKSSDSPSKTGGSDSSDSSASATGGSSSSDDSSSGSSTGSSSSASASPSESVSAGSSDRHVSAAAFAAVVFLGFAATM